MALKESLIFILEEFLVIQLLIILSFLTSLPILVIFYFEDSHAIHLNKKVDFFLLASVCNQLFLLGALEV